MRRRPILMLLRLAVVAGIPAARHYDFIDNQTTVLIVIVLVVAYLVFLGLRRFRNRAS